MAGMKTDCNMKNWPFFLIVSMSLGNIAKNWLWFVFVLRKSLTDIRAFVETISALLLGEG